MTNKPVIEILSYNNSHIDRQIWYLLSRVLLKTYVPSRAVVFSIKGSRSRSTPRGMRWQTSSTWNPRTATFEILPSGILLLSGCWREWSVCWVMGCLNNRCNCTSMIRNQRPSFPRASALRCTTALPGTHSCLAPRRNLAWSAHEKEMVILLVTA
jgi:hypothetical protein